MFFLNYLYTVSNTFIKKSRNYLAIKPRWPQFMQCIGDIPSTTSLFKILMFSFRSSQPISPESAAFKSERKKPVLLLLYCVIFNSEPLHFSWKEHKSLGQRKDPFTKLLVKCCLLLIMESLLYKYNVHCTLKC